MCVLVCETVWNNVMRLLRFQARRFAFQPLTKEDESTIKQDHKFLLAYTKYPYIYIYMCAQIYRLPVVSSAYIYLYILICRYLHAHR